MNNLVLPIGPACIVCKVPSTIKCTCDSGEYASTYLCEPHAIEHLNREGEHQMEIFKHNGREKFPIELDEETLESCYFKVSGHNRPITSIALARKFLITGEKDGIYKWDIKSKALLYKYVVNDQVWSVANYFSLAAAGLDNCSVLVFDINTYEQKFEYKVHEKPVLAVKFAVSGDYLISGCAQGVQVVYSIQDNKIYSKDNVHTDSILCISVSPESNFVVTGCKNGEVVIWSFEKKQTHFKLKDDNQAISAVSFIDRHIFVFGGFSGIIRFWNINGKIKSNPDIVQTKRKIVSFVASSDGKHLFVSDSNNRVSKYKIDLEKKCNTLEQIMENLSYVVGLTLDQTNTYLYVIWGGITVKVFDTTNIITLYKVIGHDKLVAVRKTNDRKYLVAAYMDGGISFFELNSGVLIKDFEDFYVARDMLENYPELGVEFDPDEY